MRQSLSFGRVASIATVALFVAAAALWVAGESFWWVAAAGVFALTVGLAKMVLAHRYRNEYAQFALLHGWDFTPRTTQYNSRFASAPFSIGEEQQQRDVLRGSLNGLECATFVHQYETGGSDPAERRKQTFQVTLVELPVNLPRLELIPESLVQRVAKTVGAMDITFESEAFNRRWRVRAADRRYAHDLLDPRMLDRLIQPDAEGAMIRIEGGAVMTWQSGRIGIEGLAARLGVLTAIARRIPDHVLREYTERGLASHHGRYAPDGEHHRPLVGPDWAITPGALTSRQYTGIGAEDESPTRP